MRTITALTTALALLIALAAGSAIAHHDGLGNLPPNNPHSAGLPQFGWDEGSFTLIVLDADSQPTGVPVALDRSPVDFENGNYWHVFRFGEENGAYAAALFESFLPTGDVLFKADGDFTFEDFVNPATTDPLAPGDWIYFQDFPHEHHVVLHAGTAQERCVDLAGGNELNNPNQHNAVHIGAAGQHTEGGFSNAGHQIGFFTCEDAGY